MIEHYSQYNLSNSNVEPDVLGRAYEYLIKVFADQSNKKAGEFYTPRSVVRLMGLIVNPQQGETIYDPACGTAGMLLECIEQVKQKGGDYRTLKLYGQEKNPTTWKLAKMNLLLNNVRGDITEANSFYADPYDAFEKFDYVMANPPFNVDEVVYDKVKDDKRFNEYGIPKNKSKSTKKSSDKKGGSKKKSDVDPDIDYREEDYLDSLPKDDDYDLPDLGEEEEKTGE